MSINTNKSDIIFMLLSEGMNPRQMELEDKFTFSGKSYFSEQLEKAAKGDPINFEVKCENLGNCYNKYHVIVANYDPAQPNHPGDNWGKVAPKFTVKVGDINFARFEFEVDSSD